MSFLLPPTLVLLDNNNHSNIAGEMTIKNENNYVVFYWKSHSDDKFDISNCDVSCSNICFTLNTLKEIRINQIKGYQTTVKFELPSYHTSSIFIFPHDTINGFYDLLELLRQNDCIQLQQTNKADQQKINSMQLQQQIQQYTTNGSEKEEQYFMIYTINPKYAQQFPSENSSSSFKYDTNTYITLYELQIYNSHFIAMKTFEENYKHAGDKRKEITLDEFNKDYVSQDGKGILTTAKLELLKKEMFIRGLTNELRPIIWPYLFCYDIPDKTIEENEAYHKTLYEKYKLLSKQLVFCNEQMQYVEKILQVISNDVKRTDKASFAVNPESPALPFLENILVHYLIYNANIGYVQGMGDLVAQFMHVYIKEYFKDHVIFWDGKEVPTEEAESFVFWHFHNLLRLSSHNDIFTRMQENQTFIAERVFHIISNIHPSMSRWLTSHGLSNLLFMFRFFLLQYKREFPEASQRLWDTFYSVDNPYSFISFFSAAVLFYSFPYFGNKQNTNLGEVMFGMDSALNNLNAYKVLSMSIRLYQAAIQNREENLWLFMSRKLEEKNKFSSKFLQKAQQII